MTDVLANQSYFDLWRQNHYYTKSRYQSRQTSFVVDLLPEIAVQINSFEIFSILQNRLGSETLQKALNPDISISSPVKGQPDSNWIKKSNMVGINVRTIGNFFNIIKYALTIPESQDSIHILPIWEPGVVGSLYGMISWNINPEFFSQELASTIPALNTVEKQLKVVVNLLHAMGKTVGLDVIPHNDRFSEMVIAYPRYFEWVKRVGGRITNNSDLLYREIEEIIWLYLHRNGTANGTPISYSRSVFFSPEIPIISDEQRFEIIFGPVSDYKGRLRRRVELMQDIINQGFETLPMTMAPPYRGLHINPEDFVMDENGNRWYTYEFDEPQAMSRVFGPLTRYKFYANQKDSWELDFEQPNALVWEYLNKKYFECQHAYNFDFMRGDMAHVQPRPEGVPAVIDEFYDPLRAIKKYVQKNGMPHFAYFAETFMVEEPNVMGYGSEFEHLAASEADSTLGDLQSCVVGSAEFYERFINYYKRLKSEKFAPNFTIITADKDDPRFDEFYRTANHLRMFMGLFLTDMPSYMSLGFETRNLHLERGQNEEYTKLYVFEIHDDNQPDKVTHKPFIWGKNERQFHVLQEIKLLAENMWAEIAQKETLIWESISATQPVLIWNLKDVNYIFVVNTSPNQPMNETYIEQQTGHIHKELIFTTAKFEEQHECRIYKVHNWGLKPE